MRKKLLSVITFAVITLGICGCQDKEKSTDIDKTEETEITEAIESEEADTENNDDLTFDVSVFVRSSMETGGKNQISEIAGISYPITYDEMDKLSGGYRYDSDGEEYSSLEACLNIEKTVSPHTESKVYAVNKDYAYDIGFMNDSDEDAKLEDLYEDGYIYYEMMPNCIFQDGITPGDDERVPAILDTLGNPDYIIDFIRYDASEDHNGLYICTYEMIYDYDSYQICIFVTENWFSMVRDDGSIFTIYECDIDYDYYYRNGYLVHLAWELEDNSEEYSDEGLYVIGIDGTMSLEDFIEDEKGKTVEDTTEMDIEDENPDITTEAQNADTELGEMVMVVSDYFNMAERGLIIVGDVVCESLKPEDEVIIIGDSGEVIQTKVEWMEMYRKEVSEAVMGDTVGILLEGIERDDILQGWTIYKAN